MASIFTKYSKEQVIALAIVFIIFPMLFYGLRIWVRVVFGMFVYVITWTVSFFFSHLFTCYPITIFIDFFEGKNCVNQTAIFLTVLYTNVIADFAILILPIPLVMPVICACLPTLKPIWTHFYPKKTVTGNTLYEFGYGFGRKVFRKNKVKNKIYMELNEREFNAAESSRPEQPFGRNIFKETVIFQTVELAGSFSILYLRLAKAGLYPGE
ncbi:hypothetical protein PoMZ_08996 [Pyricularia oryzae]|uniref:Rhodopsin domain-containing protein n=1 Tax=Pyricularia oryzae TaxID=318829 RepID=A0A4P7N0N0_PYROR|nr:hypothetical protein PoMZ_08996 [Pyricularia oryzae]